MNSMSTVSYPRPLQTGQRPPSTLRLKVPGTVAACFGLGELAIIEADGIEDFQIRQRIAARGFAYRGLIDQHNAFDLVEAFDRFVGMPGKNSTPRCRATAG